MKGDLDDAASVAKALDGVWGVFAVQNTWEAGVAREEDQGKRLANLAREAHVQHFVYSSVGSAHRKTGIPHFENKWRVEETVRGLRFPSLVILRPVFFMENLTSPWFLNGDKLVTALDPATRLQMIAVKDIGEYGARAFIDAEKLNGREIDLAGDALTMPKAAEILVGRWARRSSSSDSRSTKSGRITRTSRSCSSGSTAWGTMRISTALARELGVNPTKLHEWASKQPRSTG